MIAIFLNDHLVMTSMEHMSEKGMNLTEPLNDIGRLLVESTHTTIDEEGRPEHWPPPAADYGHPLLYDTGDLYQSIWYTTEGGNSVRVDDGVSYAHFQQLGTKTLPPRPFLMIQQEDYLEVENILATHLTPGA